jgi:outer membrane protein assembly factor BamB
MTCLCRTLALIVLMAPAACVPAPSPLALSPPGRGVRVSPLPRSPAGERGRSEGADWPQFRGPGGLGAAPASEKGLLTTWSDDAGIAWRVQLPGPGASSPIVVGDRVLVTCYSGYGIPGKAGGDVESLKRHLLCFNRAGKRLWQQDMPAVKDAPYSGPYITLHGYASSTPASDGKLVYVFFGTAGIIAYDLDGKKLWQQSVGTGTNSWGSGSSPVLYKNLVIVNASIESESIVALARDTGKPVWTAKGVEMSWSTPALVEVGGHTELVVNQPGKVQAYNPDNGKPLWHCQGTGDFYVAPQVIAHAGVVYMVGGRDNVALAVEAGGTGAVEPLWRITKGSNVSSMVYHDGYLSYAHEQGGIVYCVKASDGQLAYQKRLDPAAGYIYASATYGDGKIYYVSRTDGVYVVAASPTFKQLAHNVIKSDPNVFNASPAIADGKLYLRSDRYLYCIGKK